MLRFTGVSLAASLAVLAIAGAALPAGSPAAAMPAARPQAAGAFDGFTQLGGATTAIAVHEGVAFAGIGTAVLLFDLSDPLHPVASGTSLPLPDVAEDLAVDNGFLYVATRATGGAGAARLFTFDLRQPRAPRAIGTGLALPVREIGALAVAYSDIILVSEEGMLLVDAKDPSAPRLIAQVPTGKPTGRRPWAGDIAVNGDGVAWVARPWGLYSVNLANPTRAGVRELHRRPTRAVATTGRHLFALLEDSSLEVWLADEVARPPVLLAGLAPEPRAIAAALNRVFILDQAGRRLRAFDTRSPAEPWMVDEAWVAAQASSQAGLAVAGDTVALALEHGGVLAAATARRRSSVAR